MGFSKLKEGVVALSRFLAGHVIWLGITLYSIWLAFGQRFEAMASSTATSAIAVLQNQKVGTLLKVYGFEPLMPAFTLFLIIFILDAHRELLARFGRFIPPELMWHYMPGLRDVSPGRWAYILNRLGPNVSFEDLRIIVEARYRTATATHWLSRHSDVFNILKSLALLDAILGVLPTVQVEHRLTILGISGALIVAAGANALLQVYHERNQSFWEIRNVFLQTLMAENAGKQKVDEGENVSPSPHTEAVNEFCNADRRTPVFTLGWSLPLIGSLGVLKESFARTTRDDKRSTG